MAENELSSISKANSYETIAEFWDSHDFTEFDTDIPDAQFEVMNTVPFQLGLLHWIEARLAKREVEVGMLLDQWLSQKLAVTYFSRSMTS